MNDISETLGFEEMIVCQTHPSLHFTIFVPIGWRCTFFFRSIVINFTQEVAFPDYISISPRPVSRGNGARMTHGMDLRITVVRVAEGQLQTADARIPAKAV